MDVDAHNQHPENEAFSVADAHRLARIYHADDEYDARPYYEAHLVPVAEAIAVYDDPELVMAALLHDAIEDTPASVESLRAARVPERVINAVLRVSRRPDESYADLIARSASDFDSVRLKMADNRHNHSGLDRLAKNNPKKAASLRKRYDAAYAVLRAAYDDFQRNS